MTACATSSVVVSHEALYVYGVVRGDSQALLGPIGLEGRWVYAVPGEGLLAIVHDCQDRPYESQDPHVVERWVRAHQDVVHEATRTFGTVLPMAFDMIVRGAPGQTAAEALKAWLDEKRERFTRLLDGLSGKAEYGVQVLWDREAVAASLVAEQAELRAIQAEARSKPKGAAHLLGLKLAKAVRASMERQADAWGKDFYSRIRRCVDDVRVDAMKKVDGRWQMLLNLSCLMPEGREDLGSALDEIQAVPGVSVRFTGPWPPYSFVRA